MSLIKIKAALKKAKADEIGFSWVDEEFSDLLIAIAEHLTSAVREAPPQKPKEIPPGFISLQQFEDTYKFVARNTLYKICTRNPEFAETCAFSDGLHWYLNPDPTVKYLKNHKIFKKRLERLGYS